MSLRWRSELEIRLGADHCALAIAPARRWGARREPVAAACPLAALPATLARLAEEGRLPARCSVVLEDDQVFYTLVPSTLAWQDARPLAEQRFAAALPGLSLRTEAVLLPGGAQWLGAAFDADAFERRLAPLASQGLRIVSVRTALLDDLRIAAPRIARDSRVLGLVREQGVMVLGLAQGSIASLAWERLDWRDGERLARRLAAAAAEPGPAGGPQAGPITLLPTSAAQQQGLAAQAKTWGWTVLAALVPAALPGAPAPRRKETTS